MNSAIDLPLSLDLLIYYRERVQAFSVEYDELLESLNKISLDTETFHKNEWQLHAGNVIIDFIK
jgi:hypothetical protein